MVFGSASHQNTPPILTMCRPQVKPQRWNILLMFALFSNMMMSTSTQTQVRLKGPLVYHVQVCQPCDDVMSHTYSFIGGEVFVKASVFLLEAYLCCDLTYPGIFVFQQ
jgi:uncharacterized membrane protein